MTLPIKIGISTLTVGAITGACYAGSTYFMNNNEKKQEEVKDEQQGTTIKDLINNEYKHILLNTDAGDSNTDQEHWKTIWSAYEAQSETNANPLQLAGWSSRGNNDLIDKLKAKCALLANTNAIDNTDKNYLNVTKYCARNVTVKDQAEKEGLTIINDSNANGIWDERVRNKETLSTHFTNLGIVASDGSDITADNIKSGCEKAVAKNKSEDNYETSYNSYKEVCTKPK